MRYLKKFNESGSQLEVMKFDEIKDYFLDFLDDFDFDINEEEIREPYQSVGDVSGISRIPKEGYNWYRRKIRFRMQLNNVKESAKVLSDYSKAIQSFSNCVTRFEESEDIEFNDINVRKYHGLHNSGIVFEFTLEIRERLIEDVERIEGVIGDFHDWLYRIIEQRSHASNFSISDIVTSVKEDKVFVDCDKLPNHVINSTLNWIRDVQSRMQRNARYHIREVRNGTAQLSPNRAKYYEFSVSKSRKILVFSDVKLVDLNEEN